MQVGSITGSLVQDVARTSQERTQEKAELAVQKIAQNMEGQTELALIQSATEPAPPSNQSNGNIGQTINISV